MPLAEDTCEMGVGGTIEAVQVASWETKGTLTALATTREVVLAGTQDGEIVKVRILIRQWVIPAIDSVISSNCAIFGQPSAKK